MGQQHYDWNRPSASSAREPDSYPGNESENGCKAPTTNLMHPVGMYKMSKTNTLISLLKYVPIPTPYTCCLCWTAVVGKKLTFKNIRICFVQCCRAHCVTEMLSLWSWQQCFLRLRLSKIYIYIYIHKVKCGPVSVVGIATAYGLDGPGIESRWGRDFPHLSRPALRPTQPPVQWVPGLSRGVRCGRGVTLTPHPFLVPRSKIE
jgi:hypothetical protein